MSRTSILTLIGLIIVFAGAWYIIAQQRTTTPTTADPAASTVGAVQQQPIASVNYTCDGGKTIQATYYQGTTTPPAAPGQPPQPGGSVALTLSDGRAMTLPQTISADGALRQC